MLDRVCFRKIETKAQWRLKKLCWIGQHHWIYYCNEVELLSDCEGLLGMMDKCLCDIDNTKLQKILERAAIYNWILIPIKEKHNKICDALSRLSMQICLYLYKHIGRSPILLPMIKELQSDKNNWKKRTL